MKRIMIICLMIYVTGCNREVNIRQDRTEQSGLITYKVTNPTDQNIEVLVLGFNYLDQDGELIRTDTVLYQNAGEMERRTFLKANDFTWVTQMPPVGTDKAEAFIVRYE